MWLPSRLFAAAFAGAGFVSFAGVAQAATCSGATPAPGAEVRGPVLHVLDGETLCIGRGFTPDAWIPIRLAPPRTAKVANAPAAKGALMAAAFGKDAVCRIEAVQDGVAIASCRVEGRSIAEEVRRPAALKSAANWR